MITKIRYMLTSAALLLSFGLMAAPALAYAQTDSLKGDACTGLNQLNNGGNSTDCTKVTGTSVNDILVAVVNILSIIVGFAAVVMIIVGGLKFITANGDSSGIASARSTIIYAIVGLVIVAIAQVLVHFVLNKL